MRLSALADVSKADEKEKMAVAKFLAVRPKLFHI